MKKALSTVVVALALSSQVALAEAPKAGGAAPAPSAQLPAAAPAPVVMSDGSDHWNFGGDGNSGGHLDAGFELLIIRPYFEHNPALTTSSTSPIPGGGGTNHVQDQANFDYQYTANPRAWVGYVMDCGLGFRVGWWRFDQAANSATVTQTTAPTAGTSFDAFTPVLFTSGLSLSSFVGAGFGVPATLAVTSDLKIDVWDFEATGLYHTGAFIIEGSAGVRYAHIAQSFNAFGSQAAAGAFGESTAATLLSGHNFNGAGPTASVDLRYALGDGGLGLYSKVRGAVLFGGGHANAYEQEVFTPAVGTAFVEASSFHSDRLGVLGMGECEIGVEYARKMGDSSLFVRAGIDGQLWLGAGSATFDAGNLGFFGYTVTVGVNY